jgi:hypothetical protein
MIQRRLILRDATLIFFPRVQIKNEFSIVDGRITLRELSLISVTHASWSGAETGYEQPASVREVNTGVFHIANLHGEVADLAGDINVCNITVWATLGYFTFTPILLRISSNIIANPVIIFTGFAGYVIALA